jgi:hypothetical protein
VGLDERSSGKEQRIRRAADKVGRGQQGWRIRDLGDDGQDVVAVHARAVVLGIWPLLVCAALGVLALARGNLSRRLAPSGAPLSSTLGTKTRYLCSLFDR